jgi:sugar/nucleoside kinase (ribokinase family)
MSIFCLGDLVLDVIVRLEQPLATGADATSRIVLRPGGQAANVAAWIAALGGSSHFVGKRGADDAGMIAASRLRDLGVGLLGPGETTGNGVIVALVDPSGERTMCPDRGVAVELRPEEIEEAWFVECNHLHVSVRAAAEPSASRDACDQCAADGARVSIDLVVGAIRDVGGERFRLSSKGSPRCRLRQRGEEEIVGGPSPELPGSSSGAAGRRSTAELPCGRVDHRHDGAGDAFAAGWLVGGPELALAAGARCVHLAGSMPEGPVVSAE